MNLDEAIEAIVEGKRSQINPKNASVFNESNVDYIKAIQSAPRNRISLEKAIEQKRNEIKSCNDSVFLDLLLFQRDAMQRLLHLILRVKNGQSLEGLS